MKRLSTLLWLISISLGLHAQIFVNANATGANDGSSWANAYTNLSAAITAAQPGDQLWVAAGTYLPGNNQTATFLINKDIQLYGGFDGTESMLSQRNDTLNPSILSGDLNGDDVAGDWQNFRDDNARNIMRIINGVSNTCIIDGFHFQGGHADTVANIIANAGGAINCKGAPIIRNCQFSYNYAWKGGAIWVGFFSASGIQIEACDFFENEADGGGGIMIEDAVAQVVKCRFVNNKGLILGGGLALFNYDNINNFTVEVDSCEFIGNISDAGGGFFANLQGRGSFLHLQNSSFRNNAAQTLSGPPSLLGGGGFYMDYPSIGRPATCLVQACTFENNTAERDGGALRANFNPPESSLRVEDCRFIENQLTRNQGGGSGIYAIVTTEGAKLDIHQSTFQQNRGGAFGALTLNTRAGGELEATIDRCEFRENKNPNGGAAIDVLNSPSGSPTPIVDVQIENSLFTHHDSGLAVIQVRDAGETTLTNSTLADNEMPGLRVSSSGKVNLRNSIIANPNHQDVELGFNGSIVSLGGNLISDSSANAFLTAEDVSEAAPQFERGPVHPYKIRHTSPALNFGKFYVGFDPNTPDLAGNPRFVGGKVDAGAYEYPFPAALKDLIIHNSSLRMYPIPVSSLTTLTLDNSWRGPITTKIFNIMGQQLSQESQNKYQDQLSWQLDLGHLPAGTYRLLVTNGEEAAIKSFVKK